MENLEKGKCNRTGAIVRVKAPFLGEPAGVLAYIYDVYSIGKTGGVSIITENGVNLGGFSLVKEENETESECEKYLEFVKSSGYAYSFMNVIQLDRDFEDVIKPLF